MATPARVEPAQRSAVPRKRRVFGPLTYGTLALAALVLLGKALLPTWREFREVRSLARQLRDPSPKLRERAADRLVEIGPGAATTLLDAARDPNPAVRILACRHLPRLDDPDLAVPALVAAMGDDRAAVRREAATMLGSAVQFFGVTVRAEDRRAAVAALRAALGDPDSQVRSSSASSLASFGRSGAPAVPDLLGALADRVRDVRLSAAEALLSIDPATRDRAISALLALITDPGPGYRNRRAALDVLARVEPDAEARAVPGLVALLGREDRDTRNSAIGCLWRIGPRARAAVPALRAALADEDHTNRSAAAYALLSIDPDDTTAIEALIALIADPSVHLGTRRNALETVRARRPGAEARAIPALVARLVSLDPIERSTASFLLGLIEPGLKAPAPSRGRSGTD